MARHTMRTDRPFLLLISLLLAGCAELVPEVAGPPRTRTFELDRHPTGHFRITTDPHPDHQGWTLTIEQAIAVTTAVQKETPQQYRRYTFSPLSVVPGLLQCPYGALRFALTLGYGSDEPMRYGCRRLLMREPLEGSIPLRTNVRRTVELAERWVPVMGGSLDVKWQGEADLLASYPLSAKGAALRLAHLVRKDQREATSERVHAGKLEVAYRQGRNSTTKMVDVSNNQLIKAHQTATNPISAERWPLHVAVQVGTLQGFPPVLEEVTTAALASHFLQAQICFVADDSTKARIAEEQQFQLSGRIHDSQQVAVGHWIPATVLIAGHLDQTNSWDEAALQISTVPSGELLGVIRLPLTNEQYVPFLQTLSRELRLLTALAPRTPCGS